MPRISPFLALVYAPAVAGPLERLTAPPYDVINDGLRQRYLSASSFSIVHLDLAEGADDPSAPAGRYRRAAELLADWERLGALVRTPDPVCFAYEMRFVLDQVERSIRGLVCAVDLEPWGTSVIPHERTMPGPVEDRLHLLRATATHLSAVYGTVQGPCAPLAELLGASSATAAASAMVDEQGVAHRMWPVQASDEIVAQLASEPLLIADGHHRYTTALRYRDERHITDGAGPWDRVLTLIVDAAAEDIPVLAFHRLQMFGPPPPPGGTPVADLDAALAACSDEDVVIAIATPHASSGVSYRTLALAGEAPAVRALHEQILDRRAPEGSLRFVHDAREADAAVRSGEAAGAFFLAPTTPARIRTAVERGDRLPQKSTYFWPKPRTGMVMMPLDPIPAAPPSGR